MGAIKNFPEVNSERAQSETDANRQAALQTVCWLVRQFGLSAAEIETGVLCPINSSHPIFVASTDPIAIENTRRANLQLLRETADTLQRLTTRLGPGTGTTKALLIGERPFSAKTASTFCVALRLPVGWFEAPQSVVPAATTELLAPRSVPNVRVDLEKEFNRRKNLRILTLERGAQTQLSRLSGLSRVCISHLMSGRKIFDAKAARLFCKVLLLPMEWLDLPQSSIPVATQKLLRANEAFPAPTMSAPN